MEKIIKIKDNRTFRRAYSRGKTYVSPYFVIYIVKNRNEGIRLGITTGKKLGNAVLRNRARRVITAAFRQFYSDLIGDFDIIIVARQRLLSIKSDKAADTMKKLFLLANILKVNEIDG